MLLSKSSDEKASAQKQEGVPSHKNSMQSGVATKISPMPNNTGIPQKMKESFEAMSGCTFDDVRVHYSSEKPVQYQAFAYTQGNQVYIRPGQEQYLQHELGHVEQQKLGMVRPTRYENNVGINDDAAMEKQADTGFIHGGYGGEVAYNAGLIQCVPDPVLIAALKQIETGADADAINETAAEFERITQEGRVEAGFETKMNQISPSTYKVAIPPIISALEIADLKQIPQPVVTDEMKNEFLTGLKEDMLCAVEKSRDKDTCMQLLETALSYFRDNAIPGSYIHPKSFIFDMPKHNPVDKTEIPQAEDTISHNKALNNLPYVMAQDPNVSEVLGQRDAAHEVDDEHHPVVTGQALKEALTARAYAEQAGLKSYDRSTHPQLDFQGIDADENLVYFDPFNVPETPKLYESGGKPTGKDKNKHKSAYINHTVEKAEVAKGILPKEEKNVEMEAFDFLGFSSFEGNTTTNSPSEEECEEKPTIPYTGVLDETYSPRKFTDPTTDEIAEAAMRVGLDPSEVKPAVVVKVPLAEEFAKEHLLVERYYGFVQEQIQAHPTVVNMDEATQKKILPELNRRVIQRLKKACGNEIYTLGFPKKAGAKLVNIFIDSFFDGMGAYEKFYSRVTTRIFTVIEDTASHALVSERVHRELERKHNKWKYFVGDETIDECIFHQVAIIGPQKKSIFPTMD